MFHGTCLQCGESFTKPLRKERKQNYCSPRCLLKFLHSPEIIAKRAATCIGMKRPNTQHKKGKLSPNWKGGKERYRCSDCKTILSSCYAKRCLKCAYKLRLGVRRKELMSLPCLNCNKTFKCPAFMIGRKYCSHGCFASFYRGQRHHLWIANRDKLVKRQERNDSAYGSWRLEVWKRDMFRCKISNFDCNGRIEAHHILGWSEYPELRYQTNNGITLCHAHHPRKRAEEKRLAPVFQELVVAKV